MSRSTRPRDRHIEAISKKLTVSHLETECDLTPTSGHDKAKAFHILNLALGSGMIPSRELAQVCWIIAVKLGTDEHMYFDDLSHLYNTPRVYSVLERHVLRVYIFGRDQEPKMYSDRVHAKYQDTLTDQELSLLDKVIGEYAHMNFNPGDSTYIDQLVVDKFSQLREQEAEVQVSSPVSTIKPVKSTKLKVESVELTSFGLAPLGS